jgi:hypothetical protein
MLFQLLTGSIRVLHLNVTPRIDVNLLYSGTENVFCEERKLCHFCIYGIDQLLLRHSFYQNPIVHDIFADISLYLLLYLIVAPIQYQRGIFA